MATFKNLKDLEKFLQRTITSSLASDVAEKSKELMKENKQTEVYDVYTPYSTDGVTPYYERTYQLLNSNESRMVDDNTLELTSPRGKGDNGEDIASAVEYGGQYTWGYTRDLNEEIGERPFMEVTAEELENGKLKKYMKAALVKRLGKGNVK